MRMNTDTDTPAERARKSAAARLAAAENKVVLIGMSHNTASVEMREKLSVQVCLSRVCH